MFIDAFFLVGLFYLSIPAVTAYCAVSYGKPGWLWFLLGMFLPVIAHLTLYLLVVLEEKKVRNSNGMREDEERYMGELIQNVMTDINRKKQGLRR